MIPQTFSFLTLQSVSLVNVHFFHISIHCKTLQRSSTAVLPLSDSSSKSGKEKKSSKSKTNSNSGEKILKSVPNDSRYLFAEGQGETTNYKFWEQRLNTRSFENCAACTVDYKLQIFRSAKAQECAFLRCL